MKKTVLVLVILFVAALIVIAPFFVGKTAEAQFYNAQDHMQALGISFTSTYSRSWFGSHAESRINMYDLLSKLVTISAGPSVVGSKQLEMLAPMTSFVIHTDHEIQHGPMVLNSFDGYHPIFKPVVAAIMNKSTLSGPTNALPVPIRFTTFSTMEIDGSYNTDFSLASGEHTIHGPTPVNLKYGTVTADLQLSRDFRESSFALSAPGVILHNEEMIFSVSNIAFDADVERGSHNIALGTVNCHITNVMFALTSEGEQANLKDLSFSYNITEANSNITFSMNTALQSLVADEEQLGPAKLSYTIRNIDIESLVKLQKLIADYQKAQQADNRSNINTFFLMSQLISIVPPMLEKSPELEINNFQITAPNGNFTGNALITLNPIESINMINMQSIMQIITATIHLVMPAGFVEEFILNENAQRKNPQLVRMGTLLKKSGDTYILHAELSKGILTVNGQNISMP